MGCGFAITTRTETNIVVPWRMPRTTAKKTANEARPRRRSQLQRHKQAKPEAGRPAVTATGYAAGELVSLPMFGPGTVTAVDTDKLMIKFAIRSNRLSTTM